MFSLLLLARDGLCENGLSIRVPWLATFEVFLVGVWVFDAQDAQGYLIQPFPLHWAQIEPLIEKGRQLAEPCEIYYVTKGLDCDEEVIVQRYLGGFPAHDLHAP